MTQTAARLRNLSNKLNYSAPSPTYLAAGLSSQAIMVEAIRKRSDTSSIDEAFTTIIPEHQAHATACNIINLQHAFLSSKNMHLHPSTIRVPLLHPNQIHPPITIPVPTQKRKISLRPVQQRVRLEDHILEAAVSA